MERVASDRPIIVIALAIIAIVLIGEVLTYTNVANNFGSDATMEEDGTISFSVSSSGSDIYSAVVIDNGTFDAIDVLYIYYDPTYRANYKDVPVAVGAKALTQEYYVQQLVRTLEYRGFTDTAVLDAEGLKDALSSDIAAGGYSKGLVVISGALPDTVYTGKADDAILGWISGGGSLYWIGGLIGECYATEDSLTKVDGYQGLFLGAECLNTTDTDRVFDEVQGNGYRTALSLMNNYVRYSPDTSVLAGTGAKYLSLGYTDGTYSSITFVEHGKGQICILGGDYSNYQRGDLAQVVCANICYQSQISDVATGTVTRGTVSDSIDNDLKEAAVYIYIGGYYPVYGESYILERA